MEHQCEVDQYRFSRQIAAWGLENLQQIMRMRIFMIGASALGIEVAKHLLLLQPRTFCIYDEKVVEAEDIGRNFYCQSPHIGNATRAQACLESLQQLSPNTSVKIQKDKNIEYISSSFDCVVVIDQYQKEYLFELNEACRKSNVGFVMAGCLGLYCFTFVDFGTDHSIIDQFGQKPKQVHISYITQKPISEISKQDQSKITQKQQPQAINCRQYSKTPNAQNFIAPKQQITVFLYDWMKNPFSTGDIIELSQIEGMDGINGRQYQVTVESNLSFKIFDTIQFPPYLNGGMATEVKIPLKIKSQSLKQTLNQKYHSDQFVSNDDHRKTQQLHMILNAIMEFHKNFKGIPKILDLKQANQLYSLLKQSHAYQNENDTLLNENLKEMVDYVSLHGQTQISPVSSFWGGIVAQQVLKITGMYTPLRQWFHLDLFDLIPKNINGTKTLDNKNRYNDYIALFGDEFIKKIKQLKGLITGAGASACELVKIFSMMGMATGVNGRIYVADDRKIQLHHLASHFMLKKQNISEFKCQVACKYGERLNKEINLESITRTVTQDTNQNFDDDFWMQIDYVANTVDRQRDKLFIDGLCVWYQKPHIVTCHSGMQCYSESVIPYKTVSYTDSMTVSENGYQFSTIKNFPFKTQHAIQWAMRLFYFKYFTSLYDFLNNFNQDPLMHLKEVEKSLYGIAEVISNLNFLKQLILTTEGATYTKCIEHAIKIFRKSFFDQIAFMLERYPLDHIIEQSNTKFWSGLKRCPKFIAIDPKNPLHLQFIQSAANVLATMLNIPTEKNLQNITFLTTQILKNHPLSTRFRLKTQQQEKLEVQRLVNELKSSNFQHKIQLNDISINLDIKQSWQLKLFAAASQLRALNYRLPLPDEFTVRTQIGKIKPKISTTAAISAGFQAMGIMRLFINDPNLKPKNFHANFAVPLIIHSETLPPKKQYDKEYDYIMMGQVKAVPPGFTKWDKLQIKQQMLIYHLIRYLEKEFDIKVSSLTYGNSFLYSDMRFKKFKKRLVMSVEEAIYDETKVRIYRERRMVSIGVCCEKEGVDCILPEIKYYLDSPI